MALLTLSSATAPCSWKAAVRGGPLTFSSGYSVGIRATANDGEFGVRAFFPNPAHEPILKEALKEPVAFVGGIFAGILRLDLKEEPLREWVERTVEASGITPEEMRERDVEEDEEMPQQIEIE